MTTMTVMTKEERTVLPQLLAAIVQIPEDTRKYFLGYATAMIDNDIGRTGTKERR